MTETQMRELVSAAFIAGWTAAQPEVPFALEDEPLPTSDEFALLTIVPTTGGQMTQGRPGTRRVQRKIWIQVKLWSPAGAGAQRITQLGDDAQDIFELKSFPSPNAGDEPLTVQAATGIKRGGTADATDGRWTMLVVRLPATYYEQL